MRPIALILFAALSHSAAANDTLQVKSKVDAVTVFLKGAQVQRIASRSLTKGKYTIRLSGLPEELDPKSLQIRSRESNTILSVKHFLKERRPDESSSQQELKASIEKLKHRVKEIKTEYSVLKYEESLLLNNAQFKNEKGGVKIEDIKSASEYYRVRLNSIRMKELDQVRQVDSINTRITSLQHRLNRLTSAPRNTYSEILLELDVRNNGKDVLEIEYFVPSAGWKPYYDFRVKSIAQPLSVTYLAKVYQSSGEDWKNVDITLSNVNPLKGGERPLMQRWVFGRDPYTSGIQRHNSSSVQRAKTEYYSSGAIRGKVLDKSTGEGIPFVNIVVEKGGQVVTGGSTDFDGKYFIKPLEPGNYMLKLKFVGYESQQMMIPVGDDQLINQDFNLQASTEHLEEFQVIEYQLPLLDRDGRSSTSMTMTSNDLHRMPMRQRSRASGVRGARSNAEFVYIDGIKVRSGIAVTQNLLSNNLKTTVSNVEYDIEIPYTVMSDGYDHKMKIKEVNIPAIYEHHVLPKLDLDVFLVARVANWDELSLLSGEFNIFYEGTYIGKSFLNAKQTRDTLEVDLGRDRQVVVSRELDEEEYNHQKLSNYNKEELSWKIRLRNNKSLPVRLIVKDQIPISNQRGINVDPVELGEASFDEKKGFLTWDVGIRPGSTRELAYEYHLKYPR